ncbi:MAG: AMP-binding protein [Cyclobacteriaceae bacterium]|nr:AMP-binding protein [Cyclobacteriaceae bacterium]
MSNNHSWYNSYPKGIEKEIDLTKYNSIIDILETSMDKYRDLPAFENMGKELTYGEIDQLSQNFASYLQHELGLKKGDRIALQMPNLLQYPIALFGALRAGLVVVNTNPLYTPREMKHQFSDSGAVAIVIVANFAYNLEKIIAETGIKTVIITQLGDQLSGLKKGLVNFVVKYVKKMVPNYNLPGAIPFNKVLSVGASKAFTKSEITLEDNAFLQYTGGTTGVAKGATLSHKNVVANILQCDQWFLNTEKGNELVVTALPLYHIFALTVNGLLMFSLGAKNLLITNPRDMKAFIGELKKAKMTVFTAVNTLFNGLLNQPDFANVDFSKLKYSIGGGMAVQGAVAKHWYKVTGRSLAEGYGLSETSPLLTCNPLDGTERMGSIGLPVSSTIVSIMDEEGNQLPAGEIGEICAKGPQVMEGYWERPEETKETFFGEWFRTGDIGIMDEDGFFKIVDRKKDMIIVSGFNVYPNEIEEVIVSHPMVLEVAAIGIADEKTTEAVKVFVVKKDPSLTEQDIIECCKVDLTNYKRPKHIEFIDELPKSNVGKIIRRLLREGES